MFRVVGPLGWIALIVAAFLSPSRARAAAETTTAATLDDEPAVAPAPSTPRDLHFRYYLEPSTAGARTLLLRDDAGLEIAIGEVHPDWACDSQYRRYGGGGDDRGLQVACGGDALTASLDVTESRWPRRDRAYIELRTSSGVSDEIPFDHGAKVWLDPQLVDPAAGSCDDGTAGDVTVSVETTPTDPGEYARARVRVRATGLPLDDAIEMFDGEHCSTTTNAEGTAIWATCEYVNEPHADILQVRVTEGALLWTTIDKSICTGGAYLHGGWRLPCGASVHWPRHMALAEEGWTVRAPSEPDRYAHPYEPIEPPSW